MASPFHVFRKNQKAMIATVGLLAIGAFVFLTPIVMYYGSQGGQGGSKDKAKNPVVVTTEKYGDLTMNNLHDLRNRKQIIFEVLQPVVRDGNQGDYYGLYINAERLGQYFSDVRKERLVRDWLLGQRAAKMGMVVSDQTTIDFIKSLANNQWNQPLIADQLKRKDINPEEFFAMLKEELLAISLAESFGRSLFVGDVPAKRWEQFQRFNRTVSLQTFPILVSDFIEEVKEPTDKEIEEFFAEYRNRLPMEDSPKPGFRDPEMAEVKYLKASFDNFVDPASVTDEEIVAYYKEHRDEKYRKPKTTPQSDVDFKLSTPTPFNQFDSDKKTETPAVPKLESPEFNQPVTDDKTPAPTTPETKEKSPTISDPKDGNSSVTASRFHLVSMQEDAKDKNAKDKEVKDQKPAEDKKPIVDKKPVEDVKSLETTKEVSEKDASPETKAPVNPSALGSNLSELKNFSPNQPIDLGLNTYRSLEEVKDDIRIELAQEKAKLKMQEAINAIKTPIEEHQREIVTGKSTVPLDKFTKNEAKKHGLKFQETRLLSGKELARTDIGQSYIQNKEKQVASAVLQGSNDEVFIHSNDRDENLYSRPNYYLFWRTKKVDSKVPELKDEGVRKKVVAAWKVAQARKKALEKAEELAKQARKSGKMLANSIDSTGGSKVGFTGSFTWFDPLHPAHPDQKSFPGLGQPTDVVMPGHDFMEAAYSLQKPKEVGVTMNWPETIIYVIQLTDTDTFRDAGKRSLWNDFRLKKPTDYRESIMYDRQKAAIQLQKYLKEKAGFKWTDAAADFK